MKLSYFTKYLHPGVINTGVSRAVAAAAVVMLLSACPAKAQEGALRPSKEEAQAAWIRGDYEKAYSHYNGLLLLYSRDPLYQYYTGACLVRLERDIQRAVTLLTSAINSSVNIKSVPDDVWFWYGRALQMSGSFTQAVEAYDRFDRQAGRKVSSDYEVQKYIGQCNAGAGAIKASEPAASATGPIETTVAVAAKPGARGDTTGIPAEYFRVMGEALEKGEKADSLLLVLEKFTGPEKKSLPSPAPKSPDAGQLSRFRVMPGQAYNQSNPVPVESAMPEGLIYTIQVAAYRNSVAPALFKGLSPVFGRKRQGSDAVYFHTGMFRRIDDARKALPEVRRAGFPDAFIVALMDGIQVSTERAALLEKEWGGHPLDGTGPVSPDTRSVTDPQHTADPQPKAIGTLSFRAEVMRIDKPVKPDVVEKIELLAGNRGLEMIKNSSGETVFLIGNFITFESADEYVSLLIRNGYNSARVAAYVGTQEIPVDAARELLNKPPDD